MLNTFGRRICSPAAAAARWYSSRKQVLEESRQRIAKDKADLRWQKEPGN